MPPPPEAGTVAVMRLLLVALLWLLLWSHLQSEPVLYRVESELHRREHVGEFGVELAETPKESAGRALPVRLLPRSTRRSSSGHLGENLAADTTSANISRTCTSADGAPFSIASLSRITAARAPIDSAHPASSACNPPKSADGGGGRAAARAAAASRAAPTARIAAAASRSS